MKCPKKPYIRAIKFGTQYVSTLESFDHIITHCKEIFLNKNRDYGPSWRVLRPASLTDQILIKISRVRSIDEKGDQKVDEPLENEFYGLINYSIMALIQIEHKWDSSTEIEEQELQPYYIEQEETVRQLLQRKNHDYGEIWRIMRLSSIIDIILMKVYRIKRIEDNGGKTLISEGISANYHDIINYCVFGLIKIEESHKLNFENK